MADAAAAVKIRLNNLRLQLLYLWNACTGSCLVAVLPRLKLAPVDVVVMHSPAKS